jgi:hypothetical protein
MTEETMMMYRISVRSKEPDKRKNATVRRYVVMATSLAEAKALACAAWIDRGEYKTHTRDKIAAVTGTSMGILAYNADIYGDKDKTDQPDTIPSEDAITKALALADAFEKAHEDDDGLV